MNNGRIGWLLFLALLAVQIPSIAKELIVKPTFVHDSCASVARGSEVEITIEAVPSYGNHINFQLKDYPKHGTISSFHATSDHTASLIYHHDGSRIPLADEFTFRAQAMGQSTSEPARCSITILSPPASIVFKPSKLDFGEVIPAERRQSEVLIINEGGSMAEGRLILPKGFSIPAGENYTLNEGENKSMIIEFCPVEEREYHGEVCTQPPIQKAPLELHGMGGARFKLTKIAATEWELKNLSDTELRISFTGGTGWILPPEGMLLAKESRTYTFQQAEPEENCNAPVQNKPTNSLVIISDGLSQREIELPPPLRFLPITLLPVTPTSLNSISIGVTARVTFSLINRSEFPKRLTWRANSSSGGGSDDLIALDLRGGESREITYDWKPTLPGYATLTINISEGKSTRHELSWNAKVIATEGSASPLTVLTDSSTLPKERDDSQRFESPTERKTKIPLLPGVEYSIKKRWFSKPVLCLKWDSNIASGEHDRIEEQLLLPLSSNNQNSSLNHQYTCQLTNVAVDTSRIFRVENKQSLELREVSPGAHHFIITRLSKNGDIIAQIHLQIHVPSNPSIWTRMKMPFGILLIFLLILLLKSLKKRHC